MISAITLLSYAEVARMTAVPVMPCTFTNPVVGFTVAIDSALDVQAITLLAAFVGLNTATNAKDFVFSTVAELPLLIVIPNTGNGTVTV